MPEELQSLLEKIQKDGVDKAEVEAKDIVSSAQAKAKDIIADAKKEAEALLKKAEVDGTSFQTRGEKALQQAARDVILSVADAVNSTLEALVKGEVSKAMDDTSVAQMVLEVVKAYANNKSADTRIEVLLNDKQKKAITDYLNAKCADAMKKGLEIKSDNTVVSGFRVSMPDANVEHDFSEAAITEALCQLLRPQLQEIVKAS
jgi:V/A-type H+-transporting ATPase subunit E